MKKITNIISILVFLILASSSAIAEEKVLKIGNNNSKIVIKVFSSLTCPHCANFHLNNFENLKNDFIDKNILRFEHHSFPLDLAALNAELIVRCAESTEKKFQLLSEIYKKQKQWAVGSDINIINESIKKIGLENGLNEKKMESCFKDENKQDQILNERIEAQKKYKIQSTPTVLINEKKFNGKSNYTELKKAIEKLL
tara:strand:+ start:658 stop:1251 length:594 start_codon:yes stop_codon:yes gene_type:complete